MIFFEHHLANGLHAILEQSSLANLFIVFIIALNYYNYLCLFLYSLLINLFWFHVVLIALVLWINI